MNDREQARDLNAFAHNFIRKKAQELVGHLGFTRSDVEDLQGDLTLDLLQRLPNYDCTKATLRGFIAQVVIRKVANLIRHRTAARRDARLETVSLNREPRLHVDGCAEIRTCLLDVDAYERRMGRAKRSREEQQDLRMDLERLLESLPAHLRDIAIRLRSERKADLIRELGLANSTFHDRYVKPLRQAFERAGLAAYL